MPRTRSAVILIEAGKVALIERDRGGKRYYLFPGGGVGESESIEDAAVREAREELGVDVLVERLFATGEIATEKQFYYLGRIISGSFGAGSGAELASTPDTTRGSYKPVWLRLSILGEHDVRPRSLAQLIATRDVQDVREVVNVSD